MEGLLLHCSQRRVRQWSRPRIAGIMRALVFVVIAVLLIAPSNSAAGSVGWCRSDPVVKIGDHVADIILSAPANAPLKVTGPNEIVVIIPEKLSGAVVSFPPGFGKGETVTIRESPDLKATREGIEVTIRAFVPAQDDNMPVHLEFAPRVVGLLDPARAEGVANTWVTVRTRL